MKTVDFDELKEYEQVLSDPTANIADRVDSLFCIKAFQDTNAVDALIRSFHKEPKSELLKHEICYCLGQMNRSEQHVQIIQKFLEEVIDEKNEYKEIVVHEAVEALGNLDHDNTMKLLEKYENTNHPDSKMLYETCFLAKSLINWRVATNNGEKEGYDFEKLVYKTNDPAPPYPLSSYYHLTEEGINSGKEYETDKFGKKFSLEDLQQILVDKEEKYDLFERYRALFTLREINNEESMIAICQSLVEDNMKTCGALLKHEVAYVLG